MQVALDREAHWPAGALEFRKAEVSQFLEMALDQAEERVLAIELGRLMPSSGLCGAGETGR